MSRKFKKFLIKLKKDKEINILEYEYDTTASESVVKQITQTIFEKISQGTYKENIQKISKSVQFNKEIEKRINQVKEEYNKPYFKLFYLIYLTINGVNQKEIRELFRITQDINRSKITSYLEDMLKDLKKQGFELNSNSKKICDKCLQTLELVPKPQSSKPQNPPPEQKKENTTSTTT